MNCKPGDLARIVHPSMYGRFVSVAEVAPVERGFYLPDGQYHVPCVPQDWVCRAEGWLFPAIRKNALPRLAEYAVINDRWLRPIRPQPDDAQDEMVKRLGAAPRIHAPITAHGKHGSVTLKPAGAPA